jgi:hypothetical protein
MSCPYGFFIVSGENPFFLHPDCFHPVGAPHVVPVHSPIYVFPLRNLWIIMSDRITSAPFLMTGEPDEKQQKKDRDLPDNRP